MEDDREPNARTRGIIATIEGFFACMWFGWGQAAAPPWMTAPLFIGTAASVVVLVAGVLLAVRSKGQRTPMRAAATRRRYNIIVGLEFGILGIGAELLGVFGFADWIPVWVCAGVGVHFLPLSVVFPHIGLGPLGLGISVVAVAALVVGLNTDVAPGTVTGPATGLCLLVAACFHLGGRLIPRREPVRSR